MQVSAFATNLLVFLAVTPAWVAAGVGPPLADALAIQAGVAQAREPWLQELELQLAQEEWVPA